MDQAPLLSLCHPKLFCWGDRGVCNIDLLTSEVLIGGCRFISKVDSVIALGNELSSIAFNVIEISIA